MSLKNFTTVVQHNNNTVRKPGWILLLKRQESISVTSLWSKIVSYALTQKIAYTFSSYMKHLIGRVNTEVVDWKIHEARSLFEYTMKRDANGAYKVPMESLWIELHAGGISKENERQVRKYGSNSRSVHQNLSFNERVDKYQPNPVILPPVSGSTNDFQTHGWLTGQTGRH